MLWQWEEHEIKTHRSTSTMYPTDWKSIKAKYEIHRTDAIFLHSKEWLEYTAHSFTESPIPQGPQLDNCLPSVSSCSTQPQSVSPHSICFDCDWFSPYEFCSHLEFHDAPHQNSVHSPTTLSRVKQLTMYFRHSNFCASNAIENDSAKKTLQTLIPKIEYVIRPIHFPCGDAWHSCWWSNKQSQQFRKQRWKKKTKKKQQVTI